MNLNNVPIPVILGYVAQLTDLKLEVTPAAFYLHPPEENLDGKFTASEPGSGEGVEDHHPAD